MTCIIHIKNLKLSESLDAFNMLRKNDKSALAFETDHMIVNIEIV